MTRSVGSLGSHYALETTSLAFCLKVKRLDGTIIGMTETDTTLNVDLGDGDGAIDYTPTDGFSRSEIEIKSMLKVSTLEIKVLLTDEATFTATDLRQGVYDGCRVVLFECDWTNPQSGGQNIWFKGVFGEIKIDDLEATIEVRSLESLLKQASMTEKIAALCQADLGDSRCQVPLISGLTWGSDEVVTVGSIYAPTSDNKRLFKVTVGGNSGTTEPSWNTTVGGTTIANQPSYGTWQADTIYNVGDWVEPTTPNGFLYRVTSRLSGGSYGNHRWWMIRLYPNTGNSSGPEAYSNTYGFNQIEFRATAAGADLTSPGQASSAAFVNEKYAFGPPPPEDYEAANLFDDHALPTFNSSEATSDAWRSWFNYDEYGTIPDYDGILIVWDFGGSPQSVFEVWLQAVNADFAQMGPKLFDVAFSDDWNTTDKKTNYTIAWTEGSTGSPLSSIVSAQTITSTSPPVEGRSGLTEPAWGTTHEGETLDKHLTWTAYVKTQAEYVTLDAWNRNGTVISVASQRKFTGNPPSPEPAYFSFGRVEWKSGPNIGTQQNIEWDNGGGTYQLMEPPPYPIANGHLYTLWRGCMKDLWDCRDIYDNIVNHRGIFCVPTNDIAYSSPGGQASSRTEFETWGDWVQDSSNSMRELYKVLHQSKS